MTKFFENLKKFHLKNFIKKKKFQKKKKNFIKNFQKVT